MAPTSACAQRSAVIASIGRGSLCPALRGADPARSGEFDREDTALARQIADKDLPAVQLDGFAADREPEAEPRAIYAALLEGTKEHLRFSRRKAAALVFDIDEDLIIGGTCPEPDVA